MRIKMKVELEKSTGEIEEFEVTADARDVRTYESEYGVSWLTTDLSFNQLAQLAWITARRQKKYTGSWEGFNSEAVDVSSANVDKDGEVESDRPTEEAPTESQLSG